MTALDRALINVFNRPASRSDTAVAEPPAATPPDTRCGGGGPCRAAFPGPGRHENLPSPSGRGAGGEGSSLPSTSGRGAGGEGGLQPMPANRPRPRSARRLPPCWTMPFTRRRSPSQPRSQSAHRSPYRRTRYFKRRRPPLKPRRWSRSAKAHPCRRARRPARRWTRCPPKVSRSPRTRPRPSWRPMLQVDRVIWPSIHSRLQTTAAAAIAQMKEGLLSICASGSKVLGLTSCTSGEGVTTLLTAAARTLLGQGRKVVLVDANWSNPQLAQSLGLLPQIGWEETLCGGLPLEEVVIESLADGLAVLPVREPSASTITQGQIAASFDILAREFDVVLVDLGPLAQLADESNPARGVAARMDAVIVVQNVRVTTPNRLAEVRQHWPRRTCVMREPSRTLSPGEPPCMNRIGSLTRSRSRTRPIRSSISPVKRTRRPC